MFGISHNVTNQLFCLVTSFKLGIEVICIQAATFKEFNSIRGILTYTEPLP